MTIFRGEPGLAGFTGAKDSGSGGDNSSCKTCKAIVKLSPPTNQHPTFYRPDTLPVIQPTVSTRSTWENGNLRSVCVCVRVCGCRFPGAGVGGQGGGGPSGGGGGGSGNYNEEEEDLYS